VPDLQFVLAEPEPRCDQSRAKSGKVRCELPPDHILGRNVAPFTVAWHTGRGRDGRWITWKVEVPDAPDA
jgi:hypothetical protein